MLDLSQLFDRFLPADPLTAAVVMVCLLALLVALAALRIVTIALSKRGGR